MQRYQWRISQLMDRRVNLVIAQIISVGRSWQWRRNTTWLLHGAPPAEGTAQGLKDAKEKVLEGLPD